MQINDQIFQEICEDAGEKRVEKARQYINKAKVEISNVAYENKDNFSITGIVDGNYGQYTTQIEINDGELDVMSCECEDYFSRYSACKHIVATLMKFKQPKYWDKNYNENNNGVFIDENEEPHKPYVMTNFRRIVNELYNEQMNELNVEDEILENKVKIETRLIADKYDGKLRLEFKIGNNRMYKLKDLKEFYTNVIYEQNYKYGDKLEFVHKKENFTEESQPVLEIILRYAEMLIMAQNVSRYSYYESTSKQTSIPVTSTILDEIFDMLKHKKIPFENGIKITVLEFKEEDPDIRFELVKTKAGKYKIKSNKNALGINTLDGKKYTYVFEDDILYRCSDKFKKSTKKMIELFKSEYVYELDLEKEDLQELYGVMMPQVDNCIKLKGIDEKEVEEYKPKKLGVKMYLDYDKNDYITSDIRFCYGDEEFNPLDENAQIKVPRNLMDENKKLNILMKTGFMTDYENKRFILPKEEDIYNFLSSDIEYYMKNFEVLATDNFKTKEIRKPKIGTIGIKVENNLLSVDLSKINVDKQELQDIMQKYKLKKKYYRLKNGDFIDLEESHDIEFLDKLVTGMDLDYTDLEKEEIRLPVNRTLYLNELLKKQEISNVSKNSEFKKIVENMEHDNINEEIFIPENMDKILRDYQKIGFRWLKVLDSYHFGGILADDMGLGKTLQVISIVLDYVQKSGKDRKTTIVVSPSSLTLNWKNEVQKFAPDLKIQVIRGNAVERKEIISNIENYDIVITSYDLLKRDISIYNEKNYCFKYVIADEAQYMKNSNTQNAKAIKKLNAETRFALTGTPIENSLAELWSIFDFVMPGYLFSYKKFKSLYETPIVKEQDEQAMKKLKMLIEPFILRRNKTDVLTELPEKTITVVNNQMEQEQEMIYLSYLSKIKKEVAEEINMNGFEKSQIKILAGLTRLRQICCHPGLFLKDYKGMSSKLSQCMEIMDDAIQSNHKILLFSGYTSMFEIIEKQLRTMNIKYFKLTGNTKVDERIALVDEFNTNPDIKVFLISLKAGGTGLNLTGADMVIHYDPWWNQSAENQATDRAYRIGQKNNVQVYKLITSNSIEEKIYELQQKKANLVDNMLSTKTSFINKFSKDEIMSLFDE